MPAEQSANEAFLEIAKFALTRTTWGFDQASRQNRDDVADIIEKMRRIQRRIEESEQFQTSR